MLKGGFNDCKKTVEMWVKAFNSGDADAIAE
jgi:hypothetical protein